MNTSALLRWCDHLFPDYRGEKTVSDSVNSTSLSETIALRGLSPVIFIHSRDTNMHRYIQAQTTPLIKSLQKWSGEDR
jgi:hypothetical protein